ncbi:MAG: DUF2959 domain-containing protein [Phycisphaerae bacterium]|nr:MAG: DUF2959 domain-containing protein [Phycisphaerae bacterium]
MLRSTAIIVLMLATSGLLGACSSAGIALKEKFGYAKREQLVDNVKDARDAQQEAKVTFASALDEFLAVTKVSGGELESQYKKLRDEHERAQSKADAVRGRIKDVDRVATALFKEWNEELKQYSSDALRRSSERQLMDTQRQYDRLFAAMKAAEAKMDPVLAAFKDQVLFLKHNLNARAIAGLQGTTAEIERDVTTLIREMEASIAESNRFIEQMQADAPKGG